MAKHAFDEAQLLFLPRGSSHLQGMEEIKPKNRWAHSHLYLMNVKFHYVPIVRAYVGLEWS